MPSVLIIGASGMLGWQVFLEASRRYGADAHGTYRTAREGFSSEQRLHRVDLKNNEEIASLVRKLKPSVMINCAGVVRSICSDEREAQMINAELPHALAALADEAGARLVHVSTDCVFSGTKGGYRETDPTETTDLYSRTKAAGEVLRGRHLTVRSSFIGFELGTSRGLLAWFLSQKGRVKGYRKAIWSGLTCPCVAKIFLDLAFREDVRGLLHVADRPISKYELLTLCAEIFEKKDVQIEPVDDPRIDMSLNHDRLAALGISAPPMRGMLTDLKKDNP